MRRLAWAFIFVCAAHAGVLAASDTYLTDAIKNPSYARALTKLFGDSPGLPSWTQQVLKTSGDYVGTPATFATIAGAKYELFHACKAHDCTGNELEVMFAPNGAQAWGALIDNGKPVSYLGAPSPAQQSALKSALQQ
jgi:Inhibitor of vertebrate lysozyme (Ivy)